MRNAIYSGLWWLPADPDQKLSGRLDTSISEPPRLALIGALAPVERMADRNDYPVLHGFTDNGKRITLVHCQTATHNFNAPGFPTQELVASTALIGGHFPTPESVSATVTYAEFTYLQEWLGPGGFAETIPDGGSPIEVRYTRRVLPTVPIADSTVEIVTGWRTRGDMIRERTIEATSSVKVTWEKGLEDVIAQRLAPIQDLLTVGTGLPNHLTRLDFKSDSAEKNRDDDLIEAIFPVTVSPSPRRVPTIHDMLFAYPQVEDIFRTLLTGWFDAHATLRDVCALYFTVRRNQPAAPLEITFLTLVRALEVFDRVRNGNCVRPRAEHRDFVRAIVDAVPAAVRTWLKEKLAFSNEPSLRQRVARLLDDVGDVIDPIAGDREVFARNLADTRNYYTHYDESLLGRAATGTDLFHLNQRLSVFVAALLLRATGIDQPRLTALFREDQSYVWLMRVQMGHEV